jgi:hypothetical protein
MRILVGGFDGTVGTPTQQSRLELGCVAATDSNGRTIWIADAHRDDGKRFVACADEKLIAFAELESAIQASDSCILLIN